MQHPDEESCDSTAVPPGGQVSDEHTDNTESADHNQAPQLSAIELRVLGVLMEKQLTTPDQYPLTLNSVITACNQKSSREPISSYNQGEVHRALQALSDKHFIRKERSSRSEKFSQQFMQYLELGRKQQALLCVMMLRGPQTISELNTRTQRMCTFTDREDLELCIDRLCNRNVPYAIKLNQQPGQRGERIGHLFSDTPNIHGPQSIQNQIAPSTAYVPEQSGERSVADDRDDKLASLELKVISLTEDLNNMQAETAALKQQLAALYVLTGHGK